MISTSPTTLPSSFSPAEQCSREALSQSVFPTLEPQESCTCQRCPLCLECGSWQDCVPAQEHTQTHNTKEPTKSQSSLPHGAHPPCPQPPKEHLFPAVLLRNHCSFIAPCCISDIGKFPASRVTLNFTWTQTTGMVLL